MTSSPGYLEAVQQISCIAGAVYFFRTKRRFSLLGNSAQCVYDDVNNLHSTGAGCHCKTASHLTAFAFHNTFGRTSINVLLNNQQSRSAILGFELQV